MTNNDIIIITGGLYGADPRWYDGIIVYPELPYLPLPARLTILATARLMGTTSLALPLTESTNTHLILPRIPMCRSIMHALVQILDLYFFR